MADEYLIKEENYRREQNALHRLSRNRDSTPEERVAQLDRTISAVEQLIPFENNCFYRLLLSGSRSIYYRRRHRLSDLVDQHQEHPDIIV